MTDKRLTHLDEEGNARMVDVGAKRATRREAVARAEVLMEPDTLRLLREGQLAKGDVLTVAQVAGIQAAKRTHELIPMCHPLMVSHISVDFTLDPARSAVLVEARVRVTGQTGVEMEALTAASVAALTIYDMAKAVDRTIRINALRVVSKSGGRSGSWQAD